MSQNKAPNQSKPIKNIKVGKFYFIHDGSKTGHPGYVVWKDDEKNRYLVVRFDSDKYGDVPKSSRGVRHITRLSKKTSKDVACSYVRNRPMICKRKDIGAELKMLKLHEDDYQIVAEIRKRKWEKSPSFK